MSKITTKKGDFGKTDLLLGQRVSKSSLQVDVCGNIDELSSALGLVKSMLNQGRTDQERIFEIIHIIQKNLCTIMTYVMIPATCSEAQKKMSVLPLNDSDITRIENEITLLETVIPKITDWIIPGKDQLSASIHLARAICRRSERTLFKLLDSEKSADEVYLRINRTHAIYLNRVSDLLWLFAVGIETNSLKKYISLCQNV